MDIYNGSHNTASNSQWCCWIWWQSNSRNYILIDDDDTTSNALKSFIPDHRPKHKQPRAILVNSKLLPCLCWGFHHLKVGGIFGDVIVAKLPSMKKACPRTQSLNLLRGRRMKWFRKGPLQQNRNGSNTGASWQVVDCMLNITANPWVQLDFIGRCIMQRRKRTRSFDRNRDIS